MGIAQKQLDRQYHCALSHIGREPLLRYAMHHHRNLVGRPMSFRDMPFLVWLYVILPDVAELVVSKCTQVGFTEMALLFAMYQAGERGRRHTFVFPDEDIAKRVVQTRIDPVIDRVPHYREMARHSRPGKTAASVKRRHFGMGSFQYLGSNQPAKFEEFQTDSVLVDEVDRCEQAHLPLLDARLENSDFPQKLFFGNPRSTQRIHARFERSDQHRWYQKCEHCGCLQRVDWFANIVRQLDDGSWEPRDRERAAGLSAAVSKPPRSKDIRPVCVRCDRPWERREEGSCWVRETSGTGRVGVSVAKMDHLGRRLWTMFCKWVEVQHNLTELQIFYGSELGIGYEPANARLSVEDLRSCERDYDMDRLGGDAYKQKTVVAGIDVGAVLNIVIDSIEKRPDLLDAEKSRPTRVNVLTAACRTFEEVGELLRLYHVNCAVMDAEPEHHKAQEFRDWARRNTRCFFWLCRYHPTPRVGRMVYGMQMDGPAGVVTVDKTAVMDETTAEIRGMRRWYPRDIRHVLHWQEHMRAPVRKPRKKGDGYEWDRGNKRDDYRQAENYSRIAWDLLNMAGGVTTLSLR